MSERTKPPHSHPPLCLAVLLIACGDAAMGGPKASAATGQSAGREARTGEPAAVRDAVQKPDAAMPLDAAVVSVVPQVPGPNPAVIPNASGGCPVHVSVVTKTYGSGNNDDDDYAPSNVGALWISSKDGRFVRTIAVWGPNYWEFASAWLAQSNGSRVDIVAGATRKHHNVPIETDWDCRDKTGTRVAEGAYRLNVEFTEAEQQGPLLTGETALPFELGPAALGAMREPSGAFGSIAVRVAP